MSKWKRLLEKDGCLVCTTGLFDFGSNSFDDGSVVQFSTENFWFRFVSGLVAVGLGAYFVYLFVAF